MSEVRILSAKCSLKSIEEVGALCYCCVYEIEPNEEFLGGSILLHLENKEAAQELTLEVVGGARYSLYHLDGSNVHALTCSVSISLVVPGESAARLES